VKRAQEIGDPVIERFVEQAFLTPCAKARFVEFDNLAPRVLVKIRCQIAHGHVKAQPDAAAHRIAAIAENCALVGSEGVGSSAQRLLSTENTRAGGWQQLLEVGLANPLLGVGVNDTGASENSYLLALAAYGVGGLCMVLLVAAVSAFVVLRLLRLRFGAAYRTPYGGLIDLVVGFNAMYFIGAVLEGYIVARISPLLFSMLIFGALAAYLPHGVEAMWDEGFDGEWDPDEETPGEHPSGSDEDGYGYGDEGDDPAGAYG